MQPWWKDESELARFMDSQREFTSARTPMTPTYPGGMGQFQDEDLLRLDRVIASLQSIHHSISHNQEHYQRITDLLNYTNALRNDLPIQSPEKAFERLQPLRTWLFWLPPTMLRGGEADLGSLAILSQFYSVALALEPIFPEIGGSYLGSMAILPIEDIRRILYHKKAVQPFAPEVQLAVGLMELPSEVVAEYRSHLQWSPRNSFDGYSPGTQHSPYVPPPATHSSYAPPPAASVAAPPPPQTAAAAGPGPSPHVSATPPSTTTGYTTYVTSPLHSPMTPAIVGSPYQVPTMMGSRRESHIYSASPTLHHDTIHERTAAEYNSKPQPDPTAAFNPAYLGNLVNGAVANMGAEYHDSRGISIGGFVTPDPCWTPHPHMHPELISKM